MFSNLKQKWLATWTKFRLAGPEAVKIRLLDWSIGLSVIVMGLVVAGTVLGIYFGRHWVWGQLLKLSGVKQSSHQVANSSTGSDQSETPGGGSGQGGGWGGGDPCPGCEPPPCIPSDNDPSCPCPPNTGGDTCENHDFTIVGFATNCRYVFSKKDDPIQYFGLPGLAAMNDFRGNKSAKASSTYESLIKGDSNCIKAKWDKSSYYFRSMYLNGQLIPTKNMFVYYQLPHDIGNNYKSIEPFPSGLQVVSDKSHLYFGCSWHGEIKKSTPANCHGLTNKRDPNTLSYPDAWIQLPNCWDGKHLKYGSGVTPTVYPLKGQNHQCPASHPHILPLVKIQVSWFIASQDATGATFATVDGQNNGPLIANFFDAWHQNVMDYLTVNCLQANITCGDILNSCGKIYKAFGIWDEAICGENKHT